MAKNANIFGHPDATGGLDKDTRRALAESYLKTADWRVSYMRGSRAPKPQEGEEASPARVRMRIFAKGCPASALRDVIEMLAADTPRDNLIADGVIQPGEWHHVLAWWERDAKHMGERQQGDATYTLIREFSGDPGDGGTNVVEDNCGVRTTVRLVWDAVEVEDFYSIKHAGEQGYTVRISSVYRDQETGLFSYIVSTTERKPQTVPLHMTEADVYSEAYSEGIRGIRGTIDEPVDAAGNPVPVMKPGLVEPGTLQSVKWSLNPEDCTLDAQGRKDVTKQGITSRVTDSKTQYSNEHGVLTRAVPAELPDAPEAIGGVVWQHSSEKRPDGLFDTTKNKSTEKPVAEAQKTVSSNQFQTESTVTDQHQAEPLGPPPAPADGLVTTHTNEKTPGKLHTHQIRTVQEHHVQNARTVKTEDLFTTTESAVDVGAATPITPGVFAQEGKVETRSVEKTPGKRFNNTTEVRQEKEVLEASVSVSKDAFSTKTVATDRQTDQPDPSTPDRQAGEVVTRRVDRTPGGKFDVTDDVTVEQAVEGASKASTADLFHKEIQITHRGQPAALAPVDDLVEPGVVDRHQSEMSAAGRHSNSTTRVTERAVSEAEWQKSGDAFHTAEKVTHRSHTDEEAAPHKGAAVNPSPGRLLQKSIHKTPGGLRNIEDVQIDFHEQEVETEESSGEVNYFQKVTRKNITNAAAAGVVRTHEFPQGPPPPGGGLPEEGPHGKVQAVRSTKTVSGLQDVTETFDTPIAREFTLEYETRRRGETRTRVWHRWYNQVQGYGDNYAKTQAEKYELDVQAQPNKYGLEDGHLTYLTSPFNEGGTGGPEDPPRETMGWPERTAIVETTATLGSNEVAYKISGGTIEPISGEGVPGERQGDDGKFWRYVYSLAFVYVTTDPHAAGRWASPKHNTNYPCLPGSASTGTDTGKIQTRRVVARHFSPWIATSQRDLSTAAYAALINNLSGAGDLGKVFPTSLPGEGTGPGSDGGDGDEGGGGGG